MKKYLLLLIALFFFAPHAFAACGNGYSFCRTVTATSTNSIVGSTDTANFAMVISETDSWLISGGGKFNNTTTQTGGGASITVPADVIFTSDAACTTKLNWEFETYNSATGNVNIWVNIGTLSHTSGTIIYECYGNSSVTTWQGNVPGTWDSNHKGVYHVPDGTTLSAKDSTSNANDGSFINAPTATTGQIDGAANFIKLSSQYVDLPISDPSFGGSSNGTVSWWAYNTGSYNDSQQYFWWGSANTGEFSAQKYTNNNLYVGWNKSGDQRVVVAASPTNFPQNTWTRYDFTWVSGGTSTLYVNGVSAGTNTGTVVGNTSNDLAIGFENGQNYYDGKIDEYKISNTNRSGDQILAERNNQFSTSTFYTVGPEQTPGVAATIYRLILMAKTIIMSKLIIN